MSCDIAIEVQALGKCYRIYDKPRDRLIQPFLRKHKKLFHEFWALRDVSFQVYRGETIGIVGRNGSGKSTLLQLICGTLAESAGTVKTIGRVAALLELGSGFNPEFTGRENIFMNAALLGLSRSKILNRCESIIEFADIAEFIDQPVKTYSSGMVVRLAFAVAINVDPQILVVDEALAVGDAAFQRKCLRKIEELTKSGMTLLFVSHDTDIVRKICATALYLDKGVVRHYGDAKTVCMEYERELFGAAKGGERDDGTKGEPGTIDQELLVSCEEMYGDERATIECVRITATNGADVNVVKLEDKFVVTYNVRFHSAVAYPVFGIMITNREGVCVFGVNTTGLAVSEQKYNADDDVEILFSLTNYLGPGTYYLTCGVHSNDGEEGLVYLQRRIDVCLFRSVTHVDDTMSGYCYLRPSIRSRMIKEQCNG